MEWAARYMTDTEWAERYEARAQSLLLIHCTNDLICTRLATLLPPPGPIAG